MASTYLKRDLSVSETIYKWTWSAWVKRSSVNGSAQNLFKSRTDGNNWVQCYFSDGGNVDRLHLHSYKNGGDHYKYTTTQQFRDVNGWYHFVLNVDSSQSTAGDRVRMYVNGERITSFSTSTNNLTNGDSLIFNCSDSGTGHTIGSWNAGSYFDGSMSHVHYSSGYSYAPTVFGSTDSTTGEWKINTSPTFTLGGNGYTVLKDGNTITDQSSNSNDFTVGAGTLTKTEDCPSNVFCTNNVLGGNSASITIGWGNSSAYRASAGFRSVTGNIGASAGKYYAECKINGTGTNGIMVGFVNLDTSNIQNATQHIGEDSASSGIYNNAGQIYYGNASNFASVGAYSAGDIIQLAMDIDNGFLYFGKNGTWLNSSVPTSGGTGTGGLALSNLGSNGTYSFATSVREGGDARWNFGNGYFEVTAVSSAGTNASGIGIFEYDVPSGYTALSTKGLNL